MRAASILVASLVLLLGVTFAPGTAHATDYTGYVCSLTQRPADETSPGGTVLVQLNTRPNCGGSIVRTIAMCSAAADAPNGLCMVPAVFDRNYASLFDAMQSGLHVTISDSSPLSTYLYIVAISAH